MIVLVRNLFN